ncbi:putative rRNA methylase YtqB isoform X1 [Juglans microcarpa x Juglans regia]|uniref:putative rRNA methylase YtqB isoform X1 n=1 Tax=Juglans microcarpa x Juglans regia TaxID=2249226 RepID=UPI001B7F4C07|nr:putative rRNA methylase YtqB isoform X1 [Juglans microcarpa x Juglans regia]
MLSLRGSSRSSAIFKPLLAFQRKPLLISTRKLSRSSPRRNLCFSLKPSDRNGLASASSTSETYVLDDTPMSGMEDVLVSYIYGKKRATEVAHLVWKHVVKKGDTVIDATCGNGYDTLALLKMVSDELGRGCVYAMDIQKDAIVNTNSLLEESVNANERDLVKLLPICHSELDKVVPEKASVRLVAFNLGFLPGGDKAIITKPETTLLALEAAKETVMPGGLISLVVYVGHPGGWQEWETIQAFASGLPVDEWVCRKFQILNKPWAPMPVFLFKR